MWSVCPRGAKQALKTCSESPRGPNEVGRVDTFARIRHRGGPRGSVEDPGAGRIRKQTRPARIRAQIQTRARRKERPTGADPVGLVSLKCSFEHVVNQQEGKQEDNEKYFPDHSQHV